MSETDRRDPLADRGYSPEVEDDRQSTHRRIFRTASGYPLSAANMVFAPEKGETLVALLVLLLLLALFGGLGFAVHFLWIVLVVAVILWVIGFFIGGARGGAGGRRRWYGRW
jgi:hypothetical protein